MSEIKYGKLGLDAAEHSKCNSMMTLGSKGLCCRLVIQVFGHFYPCLNYDKNRVYRGIILS